VIGVRLFDSWDRRTAWEWSDFHSRWEKSDASRMQAAVLVKSPDGKYAYQRYASLVRDHLNGGQLVISTDPNDKGRPTSPFEIVPLGNIK
jgi:hypothetical protein